MSTDINMLRLQVTDSEINCNEFKDRIDILAKAVGSASKLARMCDVLESVVRKWRAGSSEPSRPNLISISEATGVQIAWLVANEGTPFPEGETEEKASNTEMQEFALIPGYNIQVSAGSGVLPADETPTRKLAFRHKWLKYKGLKEKDLVLVFADGDSMEPTISDNNTLMIDTSQRELKDGHIYVIRTNSHLIVKRVQTLWNKGILLLSDNKEYQAQQVEPNEADDLEVIGRVVWIGKDV